MARSRRIVVPGIPHHVVQRGNRRQRVFFRESDYDDYLGILQRFTCKFNVKVHCYCLMPNHVHINATPSTEESLAQAIGLTHQHYSRMINSRMGWQGYLWQGRFFSCPMDLAYNLRATKYILRNPLDAGLVKSLYDWRHSSFRVHMGEVPSSLICDATLQESISDWPSFVLAQDPDQDDLQRLLLAGKPLGSEGFIQTVESILDRSLLRPKGRPRKQEKRENGTCPP